MSVNLYKKCEDDYDNLLNKYKLLKATKEDEIKFYILALNLSGQREQLENKAFELFKEKGLLKALISSRKISVQDT